MTVTAKRPPLRSVKAVSKLRRTVGKNTGRPPDPGTGCTPTPMPGPGAYPVPSARSGAYAPSQT
ncbi:MAG TPA: hypothetical protein VFW41_00165 [Gaiellaceae bacterium]|nr:hypothetical protein [Gaiellaceae bacterium]